MMTLGSLKMSPLPDTCSIIMLQQLLYTQGATQGGTLLSHFMMLSSSDAVDREFSAVTDEQRRTAGTLGHLIPSQVEEENTDEDCLPHFKKVPPLSFFISVI